MKPINETNAATTSLLNKKLVAELSILTPWRSSLAIASDWLMVFAAATVCNAYFSYPLYLLTLLFIGTRYMGLVALVHDAAHYRLFKNKKLNDFVGEAFCALPLFPLTVQGYRNHHIKHHHYTNTVNDPDFFLLNGNPYYGHPKPVKVICMDLLKSFLGGYFITTLLVSGSHEELRKLYKVPAALSYARMGFFSSLLLTALYFNFFHLLVLYWIVPVITSYSTIVYVKTIIEHDRRELTTAIRKTKHTTDSFISSIIFPHHMNYHLGHHLYPSVPYYNLPKLQNELLKHPDFLANATIVDGVAKGLFKFGNS